MADDFDPTMRSREAWMRGDPPRTDEPEPEHRAEDNETPPQGTETTGGGVTADATRPGETLPEAGLTPHDQPAEGGREQIEADLAEREERGQGGDPGRPGDDHRRQ